MSKFFLQPLIRKIEATIELSNVELRAIETLPVLVETATAGKLIVSEGDRPVRSFIVLSGMTCAYKTARDGTRQNLTLHLAGDCPDLQSLHLNVLDMSIAALSSTGLAFIQHQDIRRLYARHPRIGDALWRMTLLDAAMLRERLLNIGRRRAYERIAHFLCDIVIRKRLSDLRGEDVISLPLTQQDIGDTVGLTNIHVNRILKTFKTKGIVKLERGRLHILHWQGLLDAANFDPTFLHLTQNQTMLLGTL